MRRSLISPRMLVCGSLALVGCAESTEILEAPLDDAIAYVQVADPLASYGRAQFGIPITPLKLPGRSRCPFAAATGRFECPAIMANGLTYRQSYQLLGENNVIVDTWDGKVAAIRYRSDISGRVQSPKGAVDLHREEEATLSELRELRQKLTGTVTMTWNDGVSTWSGQRRAELQLMSRNRMPGVFPIGTIEATVDRASPPLRRSGSITFDGSPIGNMLLSFDGQPSIRCNVDLQSTEAFTGCN